MAKASQEHCFYEFPLHIANPLQRCSMHKPPRSTLEHSVVTRKSRAAQTLLSTPESFPPLQGSCWVKCALRITIINVFDFYQCNTIYQKSLWPHTRIQKPVIKYTDKSLEIFLNPILVSPTPKFPPDCILVNSLHRPVCWKQHPLTSAHVQQ